MFGKRKRVDSEMSEYARLRQCEDGLDKAGGGAATAAEIFEVDIKDWWNRHKHKYPTLFPNRPCHARGTAHICAACS